MRRLFLKLFHYYLKLLWRLIASNVPTVCKLPNCQLFFGGTHYCCSAAYTPRTSRPRASLTVGLMKEETAEVIPMWEATNAMNSIPFIVDDDHYHYQGHCQNRRNQAVVVSDAGWFQLCGSSFGKGKYQPRLSIPHSCHSGAPLFPPMIQRALGAGRCRLLSGDIKS
jgi:hypothetical protein